MSDDKRTPADDDQVLDAAADAIAAVLELVSAQLQFSPEERDQLRKASRGALRKYFKEGRNGEA